MENSKKATGFENEYLFVFKQEILDLFQNDPLFSPFYITDVGVFPNAQYHYRLRTNGCPQSILLFCVSGGGYYRLANGPAVRVEPQQAFLLPAGLPHEYAADEKEPWSVYWLHYSGQNAAALDALFGSPRPITLDSATAGEVVRLFHRCFEILKAPCQREEYHLLCCYAASITGAVMLAGKQGHASLSGKSGHTVRAAVDFMKRNLYRSASLGEIAAAVNFSPSHLNALFKTATGRAPVDYFLNMKMQAAGKELFFSERPVKEIAAQFGIADSCYFSRVFKRVMGMSPLAYRNLKKG